MKKLNRLDKYLIFSIAALCLYTVIEQLLSFYTGYERSTLTTCFYGAFGSEILGCVVIKVFNIKQEERMGMSNDPIAPIPEEGGKG